MVSELCSGHEKLTDGRRARHNTTRLRRAYKKLIPIFASNRTVIRTTSMIFIFFVSNHSCSILDKSYVKSCVVGDNVGGIILQWYDQGFESEMRILFCFILPETLFFFFTGIYLFNLTITFIFFRLLLAHLSTKCSW